MNVPCYFAPVAFSVITKTSVWCKTISLFSTDGLSLRVDGKMILPISFPAGLNTWMSSYEATYKLPPESSLRPFGIPLSTIQKTRLFWAKYPHWLSPHQMRILCGAMLLSIHHLCPAQLPCLRQTESSGQLRVQHH